MGAPLDDRDVLPLTLGIYDLVMPESEASRWARSQRDYAACHPAWRKVPGGRAVHAFMDGDARPLCGIDAPRWQTHAAHRKEHKLCHRLASKETGRRLAELHERQRREMPWEGP